MKKKALSLFLTAAMVLAMTASPVFAAGNDAQGGIPAGSSGLCEHHTQHDETCGYAPATEGTPCTYVCEICNLQDSGEAEETEPKAECICTELCTSENVNVDCPVCGAEDADLTACEGVEAETATASNAPMPLLPTTALAADEEGPSVSLTIVSSGTSFTYGTVVNMMATVNGLTSDSQTVNVQLFKGEDKQSFAQQSGPPIPGTGMLSVTYEVSLTGDTWKPGDYNITAKVTINGTTYFSEAVALKVAKADQSLSAPTASEVTSTSVTLNPVTGQGEVTYAVCRAIVRTLRLMKTAGKQTRHSTICSPPRPTPSSPTVRETTTITKPPPAR